MDNPMIQALADRAAQPFSPQGDDVLLIVLLGVFFLLAIVVSDSSRYLKQLVSGYSLGHSRRFSDEVRTSRSFYMRILLLLQAAICPSLCLVNGLYAAGMVTSRPEALTTLLYGVAGVAAWMLVKILLYSLVNAILFTRQQLVAWNQVYADTFILTGLAWFVFAVVTTFFSLPLTVVTVIALTLVCMAEIWLAVKAFHIFFVNFYGGLQLFIYLCTLEWIPLLVLAKFFIRIIL